jgi:C-terminal processing protease CtpA/Prc
MFVPGYATVGRLLDGETVARKSGVKVGDCIVAVNGQGFRRFAPDYKDEELENLSKDSFVMNDHSVVRLGQGEA